MKIVINKRFGGFGLSEKALLELARRGSEFITLKTPEYYFGCTIDEVEAHMADPIRRICPVVLHEGQVVCAAPSSGNDYLRADPVLVSVVEAMGKKANGQFADLAVVDIPDDAEWEIDDYNGAETIEEKHRSWD